MKRFFLCDYEAALIDGDRCDVDCRGNMAQLPAKHRAIMQRLADVLNEAQEAKVADELLVSLGDGADDYYSAWLEGYRFQKGLDPIKYEVCDNGQCGEQFTHEPVTMVRFKNEEIRGTFCSPNCAADYAQDTYDCAMEDRADAAREERWLGGLD